MKKIVKKSRFRKRQQMTPQNRNGMKTKIILILCCVLWLFFGCCFWNLKPSLGRRQANCLFMRVDRPNKPRIKFEMSQGSGKYAELDAEKIPKRLRGPKRYKL